MLARRETPSARAEAARTQGGEPRGDAAVQRPPERRQGRRAWHRAEVLALDPELQRVRHALIGVDLSAVGLRVEPHPELAVGDRVRLAIYDAACVSSLVVAAEVTRDDGPQGLLLRFQALESEVTRELERILERAPQLESSAAAPGQGLVVAELLSAAGS